MFRLPKKSVLNGSLETCFTSPPKNWNAEILPLYFSEFRNSFSDLTIEGILLLNTIPRHF